MNTYKTSLDNEKQPFCLGAVSGSLRLVSRNCVNSTWTASWLQKKGLDHCQCGFECKVRVQIERNGHPPYTYIVTNKEYNRLRKEYCKICGQELTEIRGRYPKQPRRKVCACCATEKLEWLEEQNNLEANCCNNA